MIWSSQVWIGTPDPLTSLSARKRVLMKLTCSNTRENMKCSGNVRKILHGDIESEDKPEKRFI